MSDRITFVRKNGFAMAAAGAAAGLANLWRFPYLAMKYEGQTFLITYILTAMIIGMVMMITEAAVGRRTGRSVIEAYRMLNKKWEFLGWLNTIVPILIVSFFSVIGGWSIKYYVSYISGSGAATAHEGFFETFIAGNFQPYIVAGVFIILTVVIVMMGLKQGIAQISRILMPILMLVLAAGAIYVSMLPGASEGLAYHLSSQHLSFSFEMIIAAMGQALFTMGLAQGVLVTLGSYIEKDSKIGYLSLRTCILNICTALLAGLVVIPAVYAVTEGNPGMIGNGPELMYVAMSSVFQTMGGFGDSLGSIFFVMVFIAAIISAVTILEVPVISLSERFHFTRAKAGFIAGALVLVIGMTCALGYGMWGHFSVSGMSLTEFIDYILGCAVMPVIVLLTCIFMGYINDPDMIYDEILPDDTSSLESLHRIMLIIIVPVVVAVTLIAGILEVLGIITI